MKELLNPVCREFEEKKSRFIATLTPVADSDAVKAAVQAEKRRHPGSRHVCSAFILADGQSGSKDDGEPHGTAGRPMLEILRHSAVVNVLIMVTRYFGGTLLGTGGLIRAYSTALQLCLKAAELREIIPSFSGTVVISYALYNKVQEELTALGAAWQTEFGETVRLTYSAPLVNRDKINRLFGLAF
jgi:uncharacterized YigZ family protein